MPHDRHSARTGGASYPVHVMLTPVAFTCFAGALLTDIAYARSAEMQWANFSAWLLAFGMLFGVLAAVAGLVDLLRHPVRPAASVWVHSVGNGVALLLALFNNFVHSRDAWTSVIPTGLTLSALTVSVILFTALLGGHLVRGREFGARS